MKFVLFSVLENRENGLSDEGAEGTMAPRIFGLEPPLNGIYAKSFCPW